MFITAVCVLFLIKLAIVFPESLISPPLIMWNSEYEFERGRSRALILNLSYFLSEVQVHFFSDCRFPVVCRMHINRCHVGAMYPQDPSQVER